MGVFPKEKLRVWFVNAEDDADELERRVRAAMLFYNILEEDIGDKLIIDSAESDLFVFAREDRQGVKLDQSTSDAIIARIEEFQIDVLIIDPWVSFHEVDGNLSHKVQPIVTEFKRIAKHCDIAFHVVGHTRKANRGEQNQDDAPGSGAFVSKTRDTRVLNPMTAAEGQAAGLKPDEHENLFRSDSFKHNLTAGGGGSKWHRTVSQDLGNGGPGLLDYADYIGVVTMFKWPSPESLAAEVSDEQLAEIKAALAEPVGRESRASPAWVGHTIVEILGGERDDKAAQAKAARLLKGWIAAGHFESVTGKDYARRDVQYICSK